MNLFNSKFGFYKQFLIASVFLLGCVLTIRAEPISLTAVLTSLAISAATTAASFALNYLMAPKPKGQDKGKLQGEIQLSNVGEDLFINEYAGCRQSDGIGGIKSGVIFIYASQIRKTVVETSGGGGGSRGGKGGGSRSAPANREYHYFIDLACMVGRGKVRILEIKAGTDVLYRNYPQGSVTGTTYETATSYSGGAALSTDITFSGSNKITMPTSSTATFTITGDGSEHAFYIYYKAAADRSLNVTINGVARTIALPETFGRIESVMIVGDTNVGATTFFIQNPGASVEIDKIVMGERFTVPPEFPPGPISGGKNPDYINPITTYSASTLRDPTLSDYRAADEYNYQPKKDSTGATEAAITAGANIRIYEGTLDQLPDPLLQAHFEAKYGAGSTPAYRNRSYFVLENFEITKYGSVPNITVVVESIDNKTLSQLYASRSARTGLDSSEYNYTSFDNVNLRGFAITNRQAPKTEMSLLNRLFDVDVYEDTEGLIKGVVPTETVAATIYSTDLDVDVKEDVEEDAKPVAIQTKIQNEYELPKTLEVSFFNPEKDFEIGSVHATREVTVSQKKENIEANLVLTEAEAQKICDREHQRILVEKDGSSFTTFQKWGYLRPTDLVSVQNLEGDFERIRLKARNGDVPGKLTFTGVSRNVLEPFPRIFTEPSENPNIPPIFKVPPHVIGTIFDFGNLRTSDNQTGFYVACAMTDQMYTWQGASLYWERETGYELLTNVNNQATIGRTLTNSLGTLPTTPVGWTENSWDTTSTVTFDLFNGEVEARTDAEVLDRFNVLLVGDELIAFATATRVNGFPNRWTVSRLRRRLKGTYSTSHIAGERVLLMSDAVKFVPVDLSEFGKARNYKFVSSGQDITKASSFNYTWGGTTEPPTNFRGIYKGTVVTFKWDASITAGVKGYRITDENNNIIIPFTSDTEFTVPVDRAVFKYKVFAISRYDVVSTNHIYLEYVVPPPPKFTNPYRGVVLQTGEFQKTSATGGLWDGYANINYHLLDYSGTIRFTADVTTVKRAFGFVASNSFGDSFYFDTYQNIAIGILLDSNATAYFICNDPTHATMTSLGAYLAGDEFYITLRRPVTGGETGTSMNPGANIYRTRAGTTILLGFVAAAGESTSGALASNVEMSLPVGFGVSLYTQNTTFPSTLKIEGDLFPIDPVRPSLEGSSGAYTTSSSGLTYDQTTGNMTWVSGSPVAWTGEWFKAGQNGEWGFKPKANSAFQIGFTADTSSSSLGLYLNFKADGTVDLVNTSLGTTNSLGAYTADSSYAYRRVGNYIFIRSGLDTNRLIHANAYYYLANSTLIRLMVKPTAAGGLTAFTMKRGQPSEINSLTGYVKGSEVTLAPAFVGKNLLSSSPEIYRPLGAKDGDPVVMSGDRYIVAPAAATTSISVYETALLSGGTFTYS
jgi:hypothetical protein